jgi:hypothetical protein
LSRLANELLTGGRVSREAFAMLSFQPEMNACYDVVGAQGVSRPDPDRQRDAIEEWRTILDTQEKFDNSEYFLSRTREIISLLEDLDRARRGL